jgi:diguanylate cyclase (GGDEF)-like protein
MAVYVPLHAAPGAERFTDDATQPVLGAFEIYVPYAPIAASIRGDEHRLYLALALALTALSLGQFRLVAGASRRLRRQSELNAHQATHDPLTGLPNRVLFRDRLDRAIAAAARRGELVGVILLDLDRFKEINDTLGHHRGDEVLVQISERLARRLRAADSVARLGGDEFVLIVPDITDSDAALALGAELDALLQQPFAVGGFDLDVRASIGIALYPEHGVDPDVLLQRADVAMYVAKAAHSGCELYRPEHDQYSAERLELAADVRRGLDAGEFVAYYQPKLDLRTGEVIGAESLVRWQHPERGLLTPAAFIDVVENTELIGPLTMAMMDIVLVDRAMFVASGLDLSLALNVSARTVNRRDLAEIIDSQLRLHGVPASRFEIELTESAVLDNPVRARQVLAEVAALGVKIAIDDFGTGYASLAYLTDLPVHSLKIDQRFVKQLLGGRQDAAIVTFSIDLGRSLGLTVVAEGVEDAATLQRLADLGCSVAQGYHLAKPMNAASLVDWIARFDAAEFGLVVDAEVGA